MEENKNSSEGRTDLATESNSCLAAETDGVEGLLPNHVWLAPVHRHWFTEQRFDDDVRYIRFEVALDAFPTSWLDCLLTGPDAVVGKPPWGCPDIERLLAAIKARLTNSAASAGTTDQGTE